MFKKKAISFYDIEESEYEIEYFSKSEKIASGKKREEFQIYQNQIEYFSQNHKIIELMKSSLQDNKARYLMIFFDSEITKFSLKGILQRYRK